MKRGVKAVFILCIILIFILSAVAVMRNRFYSNAFELPDGFTVTAHSGSEGTPDNSMEFLEKCIELNVQVLEVDVTFRRDGTPVLLHKDVADNGEGVLFDDAIKYISENSDTVRVNLDLKSVANLAEAVRIVDKYSMRSRCFYTGVGEGFVEAVKRDGGGLPYYLNLELNMFRKYFNSEIISAVDKVRAAGAIGINCNHKYVFAKLVNIFHNNGLLVSCWTANTQTVMRKLLSMSPDNITTRCPVMLTRLIG